MHGTVATRPATTETVTSVDHLHLHFLLPAASMKPWSPAAPVLHVKLYEVVKTSIVSHHKSALLACRRGLQGSSVTGYVGLSCQERMFQGCRWLCVYVCMFDYDIVCGKERLWTHLVA